MRKRYKKALVAEFVRKRGLNVVSGRLFNTYGSGMESGDGRMLPIFSSAALRGEPLLVNGDGSQTRSLGYINDMVEALSLVAEKGAFIPVNPAYTSVMGLWKYAKKEGVSTHQTAAKVIGRRAMGLHERFDPDLRKRLAELPKQLVEAAKKTEGQRRAPGEGKRRRFVGMAKHINASPLEERLVRCNGHPSWRRTGRGSPWGALVLLRRYRWIKATVSGI